MSTRYYQNAYRLLKPLVMFFHPLDVQGLENLPEEEPVLLCANHSSNWDPILLVCALPGNVKLRIMGKKQLFKIPVLKSFLKNMGVFPVDRGNSDINAIKTAIKTLKDRWNLLVFPEGIRVRGKKKNVQPKGGVAMMAIRAGVDLVPVYIGTKKRLFQRVPIIIGKPYAPVYTGRKGTAEEYQANANEIMRQAYALGGTEA